MNQIQKVIKIFTSEIMSQALLLNVVEVKKKRGTRAIDKLMVPDFKILVCPEHEVKSKIRIIFVNEKILEKYYVRIYDIDFYFYENYKEKIQVNKNGHEYILFRTGVYFTKFFLAVEIDEKGHTDSDLIFEEKRQKSLEKNLIVNLLELIRVRRAMMQATKLVEYKHLLVNLRKKKKENKIKEK